MAHAPEIEQVARQAAEEIADVLVQMLRDGQTGEAVVVISGNQLQVEARPVRKRKAIKLALGHWTEIKRVQST